MTKKKTMKFRVRTGESVRVKAPEKAKTSGDDKKTKPEEK